QDQLLLPPNHGRNHEIFPISVRGDFFDKGVDGRFCVYTALFGDYDELRPPLYVPPGLNFICFSDRRRDVSGWEVRVLDLEFDNPVLNNRIIKILPYDYLK